MEPRYFLALVFGVLVIYILGRTFVAPLRWLARGAWGVLLGALVIEGWDLLVGRYGWGLGINPATALTVGILGAPGFFLLIALKMLMFS